MWAGGSAIALGRDLAELAADDEQAIRRLDQIVGDPRIAAEQPDRERVRAGDAALAAHRVRDRDRLRLGEARAARRTPRRDGCRRRPAAAAAWRGRSTRRRARCRRGRGGCAAPARATSLASIDEILGRRNHAGRGRHPRARRAAPGPAGPRSRPRRRAATVRGCGSSLDPDQLLDRRPQNFDLAAFLGHVLPGMSAVGVAGDRDDRDAGVQRLDQARSPGWWRRARACRHRCRAGW